MKMCLYPKLILNKKYLPNKKNKGNPLSIADERTRYVPVGCGYCMECRKQKSRDWQVRLQEEIRSDKRGKFVTLSFSNESLLKLESEVRRIRRDSINSINNETHSNYSKQFKLLEGYNLDNAIATLATRRFLERWRKKFKKSVKHWIVSELGQVNTERIHLHGILFTDESEETIKDRWYYGNVWIGDYVNERTVNYIVKYIYKIDKKHKFYNPVILVSPGIGKGYFDRNDYKRNEFCDEQTNQMYKTRQGIELPLPIYYRNKIYSEQEREELWLNLLDKEKRYVNGVECDVSKGEEDYNNLVNYARIVNKKLGYGDDSTIQRLKDYKKRSEHLRKLTKEIRKSARRNS